MWTHHAVYENIPRKSQKCPSIEENSSKKTEVENIYKAKDKGSGEKVCESELQTARKDLIVVKRRRSKPTEKMVAEAS